MSFQQRNILRLRILDGEQGPIDLTPSPLTNPFPSTVTDRSSEFERPCRTSLRSRKRHAHETNTNSSLCPGLFARINATHRCGDEPSMYILPCMVTGQTWRPLYRVQDHLRDRPTYAFIFDRRVCRTYRRLTSVYVPRVRM